MARYTDEFLAAAKHGYEDTDQPMRALARDLGIGISTLSTLAEKNGWKKRSARLREKPSTFGLTAEAEALMASLPPQASARRDDVAFAPAVEESPGTSSAAARLEALVLKEIAAEEAARADLGDLPRLRAEADSCVRRLAILSQTLQTVQRVRESENGGARGYQASSPEDLDARREALARRIEAFMESRTDEECGLTAEGERVAVS